MALNLSKLQNRLREFEDGQKASEFSKLLWKPKEGKQTVRIVPYQYNPESPFIELQFYYNLGGKHYLAPSTFGKPDPIQEVIESLRASGSNEEKELAKKLSPTARTYVPIIVRGEEEQGVRFWGFGTTVYKQLLKLMTNPKWGDITSWTEGNDIDVEFTKVSNKKNAQGQPLPETTIQPDPAKTPVVDISRKDVMEKLKDQHDILKVFPLKTYDELKAVVENWLHPEEAETTVDGKQVTHNVSQTAAPVASAPATQTSTGVPVATGGDLAAEFEKFFQTK